MEKNTGNVKQPLCERERQQGNECWIEKKEVLEIDWNDTHPNQTFVRACVCHNRPFDAISHQNASLCGAIGEKIGISEGGVVILR